MLWKRRSSIAVSRRTVSPRTGSRSRPAGPGRQLQRALAESEGRPVPGKRVGAHVCFPPTVPGGVAVGGTVSSTPAQGYGTMDMMSNIRECTGRVLAEVARSERINILSIAGRLGERSLVVYQSIGWLAREGRNSLPPGRQSGVYLSCGEREMNGLAVQAYGLIIGLALAAAGIPVGQDSITARAIVSSDTGERCSTWRRTAHAACSSASGRTVFSACGIPARAPCCGGSP